MARTIHEAMTPEQQYWRDLAGEDELYKWQQGPSHPFTQWLECYIARDRRPANMFEQDFSNASARVMCPPVEALRSRALKIQNDPSPKEA